jgi:hypothetical protein
MNNDEFGNVMGVDHIPDGKATETRTESQTKNEVRNSTYAAFNIVEVIFIRSTCFPP